MKCASKQDEIISLAQIFLKGKNVNKAGKIPTLPKRRDCQQSVLRFICGLVHISEIRFPEMGVRFIAVNDGVDSDDQMGNDFTPFRNIINEWYAKDTSKKIRAVFRNKGMSGQRLAVNAPYGYIKGEDGHLLVDEETAPVVELIFQLCVEGNGPGKIARMLKEREIPTPGTIAFQRTGQTGRYFPDDPCRWNAATVLHILEQDAYIGQTTNFKTSKLSYKSKKTVINSPDKWAVFLV